LLILETPLGELAAGVEGTADTESKPDNGRSSVFLIG
jgi:hypothetical protein